MLLKDATEVPSLGDIKTLHRSVRSEARLETIPLAFKKLLEQARIAELEKKIVDVHSNLG